jgi:hypothetical protein
LHRGTIKFADMQRFAGKVLSKEIVAIQTRKGVSYALAIKIDVLPYYLGVHYWSKSDAYNSKVIDSIKIGQSYTFYLNPTFPISNGLNSGISKITNDEKTIFVEPEKGNNILASFLLISGSFGIFYAIKGKLITKGKTA